MVVVSNTSPLHYFIAVGQVGILPQLFSRVSVPPAVIDELSHGGAPLAVRQWIHSRPPWLSVESLSRPLNPELLAILDRGEAEAIQLAQETAADVLIMDERQGRAVARSLLLPLTGSIGILGLAYQKEHLDDPIGILTAMREKGFRIHNTVADHFRSLLLTRYARGPQTQ